ncbi:MAG: hypothetical protein K8U57_20200 [Planctomycetes bacterium]|nr:hypothetical protein [Planctomycetota bacterium]
MLQLSFRGEVTVRPKSATALEEREVWIYAAERLALVVVVWALHGAERSSVPQVAICPDVDYSTSRVWFEIPNFGIREFGLELMRVHGLRESDSAANLDQPADYRGGVWEVPRRAAAVVRLVPKTKDETIPLDRIPVNGARGEIRLGGAHGSIVPARLLRLPDPIFDFDPPADADTPPELIGYQDVDGSAGVELGIIARGRVVLSDFRVDRGLSGIRPTRRAFLTEGVKLPFQFAPGQEVRIKALFEAELYPPPKQLLTIKWAVAGAPDLFAYKCYITLLPKPRLTIRPHGELPEEVPLGGRPLEFELILSPLLGEGETPPIIRRQPELRLDPPDGGWLKVAQFPTIPFPLSMPYPIRLTLDPSRLDRVAMNGRELTATVMFTDQAGTVWEHTACFHAGRQKAYEGVLAIDWGTTNTCAALATSSDVLPTPLALETPNYRKNPPDYEQFPSVLYIEDLSDPQHPVFHLGREARILANRRSKLECLIHSLKRRFLIGGVVHVRDEFGREHDYPVEDLTRLVLLRLVELAEYEIGREVLHLGFTFPTKWPAATRRRFASVLRWVAADLSESRRNGTVDVRISPPDIDEANAVALNVLHSLQLQNKLITDRLFTLVAYDFGGGTIDTSVLIVRLDETADPPLTTRYLGIGGTNDFGGDEVTRATVLLLRDRINAVLADPTREGIRYELPIRRGGDPPEPSDGPRKPGELRRGIDALRNWEQLRQMAEDIKRQLCRPPGESESSDSIRVFIEERLTQLACYPISPAGAASRDGDPEPRSLEELVGTAFPSNRDAFYAAISFNLNEVCEYPLMANGTRFTVTDRVRDTFQEIQAQLASAGDLTADIIILAGGGCRLPLVTDMVKEFLPPPTGVAWNSPDRLIYDPNFAKQRVAHGKATYLIIARDSDALARGVARSVDVLHRPLVVMRPMALATKREIVVRVGEPVNDAGGDYRFTLTRGQINDEGGHRVLWLSVVSWQTGKWVPGRIGYFDFDVVVPPAAGPLPTIDQSVTPTASIYLTRPDDDSDDEYSEPEIRIALRVRWPDGRVYGPFSFVSRVPSGELNERLQGDSR